MDKKQELYGRICYVLTTKEDGMFATAQEAEEEMYELLVDIQNMWDELTAGKEQSS